MKKTKKKKMTLEMQIVKASRRMSREDEIKAHGKPISYVKTFKNKKVYSRKVKHK